VVESDPGPASEAMERLWWRTSNMLGL
jgi:hypothetical protein